jgi:hypothetical protein
MKHMILLLALFSAEFADAAPIENCSAEISQAMATFSANDGSGDLVRHKVNSSVSYIDSSSVSDVDWRYIYGVLFVDFNYDGNFDVVLSVQNINYLRPEFYVVVGEISKFEMNELVKDPRSKKSKSLLSGYVNKIPNDSEQFAELLIENEVANMENLLSYGQQKEVIYRLPINLNGRYYIAALLGDSKDYPKVYYIYGLKGSVLNSVCKYEGK